MLLQSESLLSLPAALILSQPTWELKLSSWFLAYSESPTLSSLDLSGHLKSRTIGQKSPRFNWSSTSGWSDLVPQFHYQMHSHLGPSMFNTSYHAFLIMSASGSADLSHHEDYPNLRYSFLIPLKGQSGWGVPHPIVPAKFMSYSPQSQGLYPSHHLASPRKQTHHAPLQTSTSEGDRQWK